MYASMHVLLLYITIFLCDRAYNVAAWLAQWLKLTSHQCGLGSNLVKSARDMVSGHLVGNVNVLSTSPHNKIIIIDRRQSPGPEWTESILLPSIFTATGSHMRYLYCNPTIYVVWRMVLKYRQSLHLCINWSYTIVSVQQMVGYYLWCKHFFLLYSLSWI